MTLTFEGIKEWLSERRIREREAAMDEYISDVQDSIELVEESGRVYITHNGMGVKQLDSNITLKEAVEILHNMRSHAAVFATNRKKSENGRH